MYQRTRNSVARIFLSWLLAGFLIIPLKSYASDAILDDFEPGAADTEPKQQVMESPKMQHDTKTSNRRSEKNSDLPYRWSRFSSNKPLRLKIYDQPGYQPPAPVYSIEPLGVSITEVSSGKWAQGQIVHVRKGSFAEKNGMGAVGPTGAKGLISSAYGKRYRDFQDLLKALRSENDCEKMSVTKD